ncbi:hypothetical protein JOD27_005522 [Lentzea nigeriaca]|nr:hypothetical protein [Lentzea nigeriaca]
MGAGEALPDTFTTGQATRAGLHGMPIIFPTTSGTSWPL